MNATALRAVAVAFALLAAWRVVQVNLVLYDSDGLPHLQAQPRSAIADTTGDLAPVQRALHANPGDVDTLIVLARRLERAGDERQARRAYDAAFELAPMDSEVLSAGADYFLRHGATGEAIALLDRLVESYPDARPAAFPVLAQLLAQRSDPKAWAAIATRKPAWLGPFIVYSCQKGADPELLVRLFLDRVALGRATAAETGCLVDRLRESNRWGEAYQVWLNTLPRERMAEVGHVFNGSFEHVPSGVGFDWRPTRLREREAGHAVEMPQTVGVSGKRALRVNYNGKRQAGVPISQYLALAPGRYEMSGLARPQSVTIGRGVNWTLRCVQDGTALTPFATSERFVGSSEWRRFAFEFLVTPDCQGQLLQLEPAGTADGAMYLAGSAWFDDLVLRRRQ